MASNPLQKCIICRRERDCMQHQRAEFPPAAAKAWLRRTCPMPNPGSQCEIVYTTGIQFPARRAKEKANDA